MIKKTVSYTDLNGEYRSEDLYFNLKTTELLYLQSLLGRDPELKFKTMADDKDVVGMLNVVDQFITAAYGRKSDDGKRFIKNAEETAEFKQSEAYESLMMEFMEDPNEFVRLLTGCIPQKIASQLTANPEIAKSFSSAIPLNTK